MHNRNYQSLEKWDWFFSIFNLCNLYAKPWFSLSLINIKTVKISFWWEHGQNCKKKTINLRVSLTYPLFPWFSLILDVFPSEFWKSENSLCSYFFERNLNLQSELRNSDFEKLTSHRDMLYWKVRTDWLKQHSKKWETWL